MSVSCMLHLAKAQQQHLVLLLLLLQFAVDLVWLLLCCTSCSRIALLCAFMPAALQNKTALL